VLSALAAIVPNGVPSRWDRPGGKPHPPAPGRLGFQPNRGQAGPDASFVAWDPGFYAELRATGAVLSWRPARDAAAARLLVRFAGGRPPRAVALRDPLPTRSHYYLGNDPKRWLTGVPEYARVEYAGVYPGVDVVFHGQPGALRYDFVVAPGADPGAIALEFDGAHGLRVDEAGDLVLSTAGGEVRHRRPTIYQEGRGSRRPVEGHYVLRGPSRVGVEVAAYDRSEPLVVDPTLVYSTYLGGVRRDYGNAVAVDASGSTYIAGGFNWGDNTDTDVFVAKFDPAGQILWRTEIRGAFNEEAAGIALDPAGNVHLAGTTSSFPSDPLGRPEYPRTADAIQPLYGGGASDAFVTVLGPSGTMSYSTFLGGSGDDQAKAIALGPAGHAYVAGLTNSPNFPLAQPLQAALGGGYDAWVARMNADKSALVYSSYLGGSADDRAQSLALDAAGNAYVAGTTSSPDFPTASPLQETFRGGASDAFVSKLAKDGAQLLYSTYLGGTGADAARGVAVDGAAQVYVTGTTDSTDFPTENALEGGLSAPPNADAFLAKLDSAGDALVYSTYLGAKGGNGVAVDAGENAYVTGGGVLAAKLYPNGSALLYAFWAVAGSAIAVDESGHAVVTGGTFSNLLPTLNAVQPRNGGMFSARGRDDALLVKISDAPAPPPAIEENDARVSYTGTWAENEAPEHSGGRAVYSDETGASATLTFTGTGVQLIGRRDDSTGFAGVTTDSTNWGAADTYASPTQEQALILSITGLPAGAHTLTLTVAGSHSVRSQGNGVWIDGFNVLGAPEPTPAPTFSPPGGTYDQPQTVTLSDAASDAAIYYTTDGSTPTTSSTPYAGPISVTRSTTINAMAAASGRADSDVASATYSLQAARPTFSPPGGKYLLPQFVCISDASPGVSIYYTTNGSTPTTSSNRYTGPILVIVKTTVRAIAVAPGWSQSSVESATYAPLLGLWPRPAPPTPR